MDLVASFPVGFGLIVKRQIQTAFGLEVEVWFETGVIHWKASGTAEEIVHQLHGVTLITRVYVLLMTPVEVSPDICDHESALAWVDAQSLECHNVEIPISLWRAIGSDLGQNREKQELTFHADAQRDRQVFPHATKLEIKRAFALGIEKHAGFTGELIDFDFEVFVRIERGGLFWAGINLLGKKLWSNLLAEQAGYDFDKLAHSKATLNPIFARGLMELAVPTSVLVDASSEPRRIVLDPFCGCGTVVTLAASLQRSSTSARQFFIAGELSEECVEKTRSNCEVLGLDYIDVVRMDARHLPIRSSLVDLIATDMPFGKRCQRIVGLEQVATGFARVLVECGSGAAMMRALTRRSILRSNCPQLRISCTLTIKMGGLRVRLVRFHKPKQKYGDLTTSRTELETTE